MKNFNIIHILLFILLMIAYQCANAQDYVVHIKGDTIRGDVKPLMFGTDKKVQVTTADRKKTIYPIFHVRSYFYKGDIFQPVKGDKGYTFMKLVKPGYLSLYAFQPENQVAYDGLFLAKKDGTGVEVPNLSFKKILVRFLSDCETVVEKINGGELGKKHLELIVDEYNSCVDARSVIQNKTITQRQETIKKISAWDTLEEKVKAKEDFAGKADALEMITEIKNKLNRNEKVPNFMTEGLKTSLAQAELSQELQNALAELN